MKCLLFIPMLLGLACSASNTPSVTPREEPAAPLSGPAIPSIDSSTPGKAESRPASPLNEGAKKDEDQTANEPQTISGVYLRCATLLDASAELPTSEIACRLNNKDGNRVDPSSLGVKIAFSTSAAPAGITITQRALKYVDRSFDILFDLSGSSVAAVQDAIDKISYSVELRAIIGNDPLGSQTSTFAQAKIEPRRADWVSYLYGSSPTYVDQATSLVWALDDGKGYTLEEGNVHCNNLIYADSSDWRLPTIVELRTAHLDGLGVAYADGGNMNIDSKRFGGYGSSTLEFPGQPSVIGTSQRWSIDLGLPSGSNTLLGPVEDRKSVICVHE